jgi:hypothetical protein
VTTADRPPGEGQRERRPRRWHSSRPEREAQRPDEKVDYQQVREREIRTGDILLFSGAYALSGVIEWASHCPYSHVAMLGWWKDRLIAFQSDHRGVEVLPASTMVCRYNGKVDWWSLEEAHRPAFDEDKFFDTALTLLGIKFGYATLFGLFVRMMLGWTLGRADSNRTPSSMFCSQFVSCCFRNALGDLVPALNDASTSPADIMRSGFFRKRYRLFDGSGGQACERALLPPRQSGHPYAAAIWDGQRREEPRALR